MRRVVAVLLSLGVAVLAPLVTSLLPTAQADPSDPADLVVTGWALGGTRMAVVRQSTALDQVDVVGASLNARGTSFRTPADDTTALIAKAQQDGLRAELLVSNYSNRLGDFDPRALHRLLSSPGHVTAAAQRVADLAGVAGADGVNIDLERVRRADADGLVDFAAALQDALPEESTVSIDVSAATSSGAYLDRGYAMADLGDVVDLVVLMTYDYSGPTWSDPGPIGPLDWQRKAVDAALADVPADRLDLGIAGYGYTWPRTGTGRSVSDAAARRMVERDGVRARWHADVGEWSARLSDGTRLWWSDRRSYALRLDLAREKGLHGVAVWRLGSSDPLVTPGG